MNRIPSKTKIFVIFIIVILGSSSLFASSEGGHHGFDWMQFLGKLVNSTLLFGGLIFLLRKPISNFLYQKSVNVKEDIIQREKNLEKTTEHLIGIKERLDQIEEEVKQMKEAARLSGVEEQKKIEELGKTESERLRKLNEEEIKNKVDSSVRILKEKIAEMTIDHFKKDIQSELDSTLHDKIIEKNIEIIGDIIERK